MNIQLHPPIAINEKGQRLNNEDSVYPLPNTETSTSLFIVCDGVGGQEKGEVASKIVCQSLATYLEDHLGFVNRDQVEQGIRFAKQKMETYLAQHPMTKGMATTLTLVAFHEKGATVAHIGDSRVYQIRNGEIVFKTKDHSLVNEMVLNGIITEEQAQKHPKRNVVTRAIMGNQIPAQPDVTVLTDVQKGDYFFLCTDGILESINDYELAQILSWNSLSNFDKMEQIRRKCSASSKDNFSAYLLNVKRISQSSFALSHFFKENIQKNILLVTASIGISVVLLGMLLLWMQENKTLQKTEDNNLELTNPISNNLPATPIEVTVLMPNEEKDTLLTQTVPSDSTKQLPVEESLATPEIAEDDSTMTALDSTISHEQPK
ncbi:MAG: protein phosphatase 2C domain-containing protein [Bacteroidota bacterium]